MAVMLERRVRPIVHIGFHKTATTWFQERVYPKSMSHRWVPRQVARQVFLDPSGLGFDPQAARAALASAADPRPIAICEENLSGYIHNGGLHGFLAPEVARRIKAVLPGARIVIVVRSQADAIAASYVQYVRGGGTYGPHRYLFGGRVTGALRHSYKQPRFEFDHFEYDKLVAHYDALFGRENVNLLVYEKLRDNPGAFLDDFCRRVSLGFGSEPIDFKPSNRSFGQATILIARVLGLFTKRSVNDKVYVVSIPGFYELRKRLLRLFSRFDRPATSEGLLGVKTIEFIRAHYAASNRRLAMLREDLDLAALGYPVGPPSKPQEWPVAVPDAA